MQESDYFEDFGETQEIIDDDDEEIKKIGKKSKKNKSNQGNDTLMGELETLALGEENDVSNVKNGLKKLSCELFLANNCLVLLFLRHIWY